MTTWTDIFPELDGPPVKGVPSEFSTVATSFSTMNEDARAILEQFDKIMTANGVQQIQGAVADPFRNFVDDVSDRLGSLPEVSESAAKVFANHATKLDTFRDAADTALAKAITKWNQCKTATSNLASATTSADHLKTQLDHAPADADPSSTTQLQGQHADAADKVTSCQSQLACLKGELAQFKTTWTNLREDERKLRTTTIGDLDDIDLHALEDPGWFDSFCEAAFEVVKWAYEVTGLEDLVALIDAIAHGDWAKALWALRNLLDKVITILSIVVLFAFPELILVILVLSVIKLGVDALLYATNTPNPETGERISLTDLAFDTLDVVLNGKDVKGAREAMRLGRPATELAKGRQLVGDAQTFFDRQGRSLSRTQQKSTEKLLRRYHIDPDTTVINRGNRKALRYVDRGNMTTFYLKGGEHVLQDGHDLANGVYQGDQEATDGPSTEDITRTMDPNQSRPYFTMPRGNQWFNVMEIPLTR
jgi:hypothetical protein